MKVPGDSGLYEFLTHRVMSASSAGLIDWVCNTCKNSLIYPKFISGSTAPTIAPSSATSNLLQCILQHCNNPCWHLEQQDLPNRGTLISTFLNTWASDEYHRWRSFAKFSRTAVRHFTGNSLFPCLIAKVDKHIRGEEGKGSQQASTIPGPCHLLTTHHHLTPSYHISYAQVM